MTTATISSPVRVGQTIQVSVIFQDLLYNLNETRDFVFSDVNAISSTSIQTLVENECLKYDVLLAKMVDIQKVSNATFTL